MKWAGLETPKCITVHQRVNGMHISSSIKPKVTPTNTPTCGYIDSICTGG